MPEIAINFDAEENKKIEIFKAEHSLKNKAAAVKEIVREFFRSQKK